MLPTPLFGDLEDKVYDPSEDSFLLLDCFESELVWLNGRFNAGVVCEIGTGSGIVSTFIKKNILKDSLVLTTDLNPHACRIALDTAKSNDTVLESFQMSLTTAFRENIVDVLVFNPPYVPAEEVPKIPEADDDETWLDLALLGGDDGMVVTQVVLDHLDEILSKNGVAYILFCARNKPDEVMEKMRNRGWQVESIIHRKAGWEVLSVLRFHRAGE